MQRDMDLVRSILLEVEKLPAGNWDAVTGIDGCDPAVFSGHVDLMKQAGLIEAAVPHADGVGPISARVFRLTWQGHDFLDAVRNESVWSKVKAKLGDALATTPIDVIKALAISFGMKAAGL